MQNVTTDNRFDVVVVGGGPAGSSAATLLAQAGLRVLILEKNAFPRDKICGDCINPRAWNYFDLLGVTEQLRQARLQHISGIRILSSSGKEIYLSVSPDPSRPFFALKRSILDQILLDNARKACASVNERASVFRVERNGNWRVTARIDGHTSEFSSTYLIGADGRNSIVARAVGTRNAYKGMTSQPTRVGIQWHASFVPAIEGELQLRLFNGGYCGIVRVDDCHSNIAMVSTPAVARLAQTDFTTFLRVTGLDNVQSSQQTRNLRPIESIKTTFPINPVVRISNDSKAFLLGDAHRTLEPFTGEGVCGALEDGVRTAEYILQSLGVGISRHIRHQRTFYWPHAIYSRVLRNGRLSTVVLRVASWNTILARIAARNLFGDTISVFRV